MKADLPAVLKAYATERGHVVAVESGGVALDYASLDRCVERFATALRSTGIASGDRVAFLANTCVEYFVFLIGSMRVGAVAVPVNWRLASPEIASVLNDAEAVLLVVGETFLAQIEELLERLEHVRHIVSLGRHQRLPGWEEWLNDHANDSHAPVESNDESIVFQMYTSGTTGMPKGVMTSNAGLLSYLERLSSTARITPRSVTLSTLPLFHIGGTGWALAGLYRGGTVHLLRDVNADRIIATIQSQQVTNLIAVPTLVQMILRSPRLSTADFSSLRYLYYGGGPMTEQILDEALDAFDCEFIQGFGMTECPLISALEPEDHAADRSLLRSCGKPITGTKLRIVDPDTCRDVLSGEVGEIWVQSPHCFVGYWKQPEMTARTLVDGTWLRTGDAAYRNKDGYLFLKDRLKDMIVSGGENIYSAEVENVLHSHPDVAECAVIGVPSEKWIETVKAIVVPVAGCTSSGDQLIAYCKLHLAGYKCPTSIDFVECLPRTPSGKVMKYQLKARYVHPSRPSESSGQ